MRRSKKTIFTLNVDNYCPEITEITYPLIQRYADKIGAEIHVISERKYPDMPAVYEKLQIYNLIDEIDCEWIIYIDSDALLHPDLPDVTTLIPKDTVMQFMNDVSTIRFRENDYFRRDGRYIGCCNWFTVASHLCRDLWKLPDTSIHIEHEIHPIAPERLYTQVSHLIDDYILSVNVARYGLKYQTLRQRLKDIGYGGGEYLWHTYLRSSQEKVEKMVKVAAKWELLAQKRLHPLEVK
jgi:hypothetical protein